MKIVRARVDSAVNCRLKQRQRFVGGKIRRVGTGYQAEVKGSLHWRLFLRVVVGNRLRVRLLEFQLSILKRSSTGVRPRADYSGSQPGGALAVTGTTPFNGVGVSNWR
jgi:hypothetical protein